MTTPARVYASLLALYPAPFRDRFGAQMLEAFGDLQRARSGQPLRFWAFVLADLLRSAAREHAAACLAGPRRFALEWGAACALGAMAAALVANSLTWIFSYFYHPYLEGITLPPWSYGALVGVALGVTQVAALGRRLRIGFAWIAASTAATAIGVETAVAVAPFTGPIGYGVVLGAFVGAGQWTVLRSRGLQAVRWVGLSTAAISLTLMSFAVTLHTKLSGLNAIAHSPFTLPMATSRGFLFRGLYAPATGADLAIELAVMAICGLVMASVTARPLSSLYGHQKSA